MKSTYKETDVEILLKDVSGMIEPMDTIDREHAIQNGVHYCEMLPLEYRPSEAYMALYKYALEQYAKETANAVARLSEQLYAQKGKRLVLVSLARAGIPIGILIKRYLKRYDLDIKHYAISIIRGRGIDTNAIKYILKRHDPSEIRFIDGWTGKGAIQKQLKDAMKQFPCIDSTLAVTSDPAGITPYCGTHEDILIPSSCLNATVTGLISRTILRDDIIGEKDFHGAVYFKHLENEDLSEEFIQNIELNFPNDASCRLIPNGVNVNKIIKGISKTYHVMDTNFIKPGIGETTRVLLRRVPWKILINSEYENAKELAHIRRLAEEKNVPCELSTVEMGHYKVCGLIQNIRDV